MQIDSIIAIIIAIVLILVIIVYYLFYMKIKKNNDEFYNFIENEEERKKMKEIVTNIVIKVEQALRDGKIKGLEMVDYYPLLNDEEKQELDNMGKIIVERFLKSISAS